MPNVKTLMGELAHVDLHRYGALLRFASSAALAGNAPQHIRLTLTPRLTIADRRDQVIPLEQLQMGQRVEVPAGLVEGEPDEARVMSLTVKD